MESRIEIRKADIKDILKIKPLMIELHNLHAEKLGSIFKKIRDINNCEIENQINRYDVFIVALLNSNIVGYLKGSIKEINNDESIYYRKMILVVDLIVKKENRKKGYGKALMLYLEKIAIEIGVDSIEIPVYSFNLKANEFYENIGYSNYVIRKRKIL